MPFSEPVLPRGLSSNDLRIDVELFADTQEFSLKLSALIKHKFVRHSVVMDPGLDALPGHMLGLAILQQHPLMVARSLINHAQQDMVIPTLVLQVLDVHRHRLIEPERSY